MGLRDRIRSRFSGGKVHVHLLIRGRIGEGWYDIDRTIRLREPATLDELIRVADAKGLPIRQALADSPHLSDTLMLNGERCPVADNRDRELFDGDEVYLLSPIAGG